jgi:hypothetical protein
VYIARHQETAGESSVSVVAGVRTVTTNMISAARPQRCAALFASGRIHKKCKPADTD